jgi:hypothetical protein
VYCLPSEREAIAENARAAGKGLSNFLLDAGQSYRIKKISDYECVRELVKSMFVLIRTRFGFISKTKTSKVGVIASATSTLIDIYE